MIDPLISISYKIANMSEKYKINQKGTPASS